MSRVPASTFNEAAARRVLLVQACEGGPADDPLWTADDARWATRQARETTPADAGPARFLDERAGHALKRLVVRQPAFARAQRSGRWRPGWLFAALCLGAVAGVACDTIGASQHINLLAPPVWAVVAWNLAVYAALLLPLPHRLRAALAARLAGSAAGAPPLAAFRAAWLRQGGGLIGARVALLLHAAAAALAAGLIASLYLRGLVLDYRAGWQSTFLDASQVHALLHWALAPAAALSGIAVPDAAALQALRIVPQAPPTAAAAPWIHLYATQLLLLVVLPRGLLAAWAAARAWRLSRNLALPLQEPYFQRLLRGRSAASAVVHVLPSAAAPAAAAALALRAALAGTLGEDVQFRFAPAVAWGEEEPLAAPPPDTTLALLLVDLAATPEDERHGRLLRALRSAAPGLPLMVFADASGWQRRHGALPARRAERLALWRALAAAQQADFESAELDPQGPAP